ncbi:MAG: Crp/Fnr family transcriptional regulator [Pedobacter sp.]|nr:MAG: Crp/Fnr family transcriptional regulator [Pedobacter sp.]
MKHRLDKDPEKWKDFGGNSPLISLFNSVLPIQDEIKAIINRETYPMQVKKYKYLISPIDRNMNLFFVLKGVVRGYVKDGTKEITTWISTENDVVGTIRNLFTHGDSDEYIQALEDAHLICIPHVMSEYLYANYREANFIGRVLMQKYYQSAEERAYLCRISSAEKRYKRFLQTYPGLIERISLKYIASFLGVRLETLSRIRTQGNK